MVKAELISGGKFDEIRSITSRALSLMLGFNIQRPAMETSAGSLVDFKRRLAGVLALPEGEADFWIASTSSGQASRETGSQLSITTNFIDRAVAYLERRGVQVRPGSREEKNGRLLSVSLDREIEGNTVRVLQV